MNVHQMKRFIRYRKIDTLRAARNEGFSDEVIEFLERLFITMEVDVEAMW